MVTCRLVGHSSSTRHGRGPFTSIGRRRWACTLHSGAADSHAIRPRADGTCHRQHRRALGYRLSARQVSGNASCSCFGRFVIHIHAYVHMRQVSLWEPPGTAAAESTGDAAHEGAGTLPPAEPAGVLTLRWDSSASAPGVRLMSPPKEPPPHPPAAAAQPVRQCRVHCRRLRVKTMRRLLRA
jgi:hypothetical protein